jgi:hypothetical protein
VVSYEGEGREGGREGGREEEEWGGHKKSGAAEEKAHSTVLLSFFPIHLTFLFTLSLPLLLPLNPTGSANASSLPVKPVEKTLPNTP